MNIFTFGLGMIVITILLINIAPVFSEGVNDLDAEHPEIDENAMNLARTYPFMMVVGVIVILSFFWWRGGLD